MREPQLPPTSSSVPTFSLNDLSLSFISTAAPQLALPTISRPPLPARSGSGRAIRRPSTASSAEDKLTRLPSTSATGEQSSPASTPGVEASDATHGDTHADTYDQSTIQEMNRRAHAAVAGLRAEASRLAGIDTLPSPFDTLPSDESLWQSMGTTQDASDVETDYDWATFINAYALGRWDPLRTPHAPRSLFHAPTHARLSATNADDVPSQTDGPQIICDSPVTSSEDFVSPLDDVLTPAQQLVAPLSQSSSSVLSSETSSTSRRMPLNLGQFSHRLRNSFADMRSANPGLFNLHQDRPTSVSSTDITTSAAAIRWAAARVSVAPLALPSPEHELTDPMRGMSTTIPGSHPSDLTHPEPPLGSPTGVRKSRLSSFWQGTQDIEDMARTRMTTIEASPPDTTDDSEHRDNGRSFQSSSFPFVGTSVPPATAPVKLSADQGDEDYFGSMETPMTQKSFSGSESVTGSEACAESSASVGTSRDFPEITRQVSAPPFDYDPATVPALPRRICLTRQTSAPLPTLALYERRMRMARPPSDGAIVGSVSRAAKEEQMFAELGFLTPPNPPDELERRRALYKFNIWNTGHDMNFDRIAHLVKLVFNTRIVVIALVDGTEEFFKSEWFGSQNMPRTSSFDAHAILQRDDEPTVVLDALEDWRFAKNPLVTGHPHIRFYAGCPLRTQDGFNIGTLTIIDDVPRREFSPRQRHTLKEFAQITMRELELWRDKIQLRIRDRIQHSMEQFTRECLEVEKEPESGRNDTNQGLLVGSSMELVYERAAKLVKRTLDVQGSIVVDVSHVDVLETIGAESTMSVTLHSADPQAGTTDKRLSAEEYTKLSEYFETNPDGKICEGVIPACLRPFLPSPIQYALTVPIFNIDKRPFALLCAYSTGERTTPFLEGHELSYLRAIGVIILSAVLKRRMILADKAKSLFISNISHELRTPLHGILASAELLSETSLDHSQASFLQTVQACGTSLVETVNHVLDFTKLSGNAKAGGVENVVQLSKVDLMQLVEEATEGCWIGYRARSTSEIGSVYSPPTQERQGKVSVSAAKHVETVIDIGHNERGWVFMCEKGGIRRILMNLFGNSLKFTSDGYVHVMLRQLPRSSDTPRDKVRIELSVIDTGKGISQNFLKNQLFHPFSQENPLQTGTGLGLAIVNSIVRSRSIDGKVDVWSAEGVGTEIKVTFTAEAIEDEGPSTSDIELVKAYEHANRPVISLIGFNEIHRGDQLLRSVMSDYLSSRWGFTTSHGPEAGEIVIVNEDLSPVIHAIETKNSSRPFMILSTARGDPRLMGVVGDYERIGGFCRIIYKPAGPCRLYSVLKLCLHALSIDHLPHVKWTSREDTLVDDGTPSESTQSSAHGNLPRRYSGELVDRGLPRPRPHLGPRAITAHPLTSWSYMPSTAEQDEPPEVGIRAESPTAIAQSPNSPTISIGTGGTILKSSVGSVEPRRPLRVLVVEDNSILRNLLIKWLRNKGFDHRAAVDGLEGVRIFESDGYFDVVLVDLSMPVLDGIGATIQMRGIESARKNSPGETLSADQPHAARILALTGMSSLEDKRRAFEAGVDGYLVKPVAFKTLDMLFQKLGVLS